MDQEEGCGRRVRVCARADKGITHEEGTSSCQLRGRDSDSDSDSAGQEERGVQAAAASLLAAAHLWLLVPVAEAGADDGFGEHLGEALFGVQQQANELVQAQLASLGPASVGVILGAGLLTSLSPCTLSVLPLTIGYIGGYDTSKTRFQLVVDSLAFALGLATTLAGLGIAASLAGKAYGQIGPGLPIAVACVAILMGLNLLEVVPLRLPSFFSSFDPRQAAAGLPTWVQAYLAGLTFALAASPCSTPVLASILAYVASKEDPVTGGGLLLAYTSGYVAPLLIAASFTGALKRLLALRQLSAWINPTSGALLLGGGVYALLTRVVPDSSDMAGMVM